MIKYEFLAELDSERVMRLGNVYSEIGHTYFTHAKKEETIQNRISLAFIAATYFRRSAAHSLLLSDLTGSQESFEIAGHAYRLAESPYCSVMFSLSGISFDEFIFLNQKFNSAQMIYPMIEALQLGSQYQEQLIPWRSHIDEFRGKRLGILSIPVDNFIDLFDSLQGAIKSKKIVEKQLMTVLLPFVNAYGSAFIRAKRDTYHWKLLAIPFHPVEPDIIGLLTMVSKILSPFQYPIDKILIPMPIPNEPLSVLRQVLSITHYHGNNIEKKDM